MKKGLYFRKKIVRVITYTALCVGAETTLFIMATTILDKLFF